MLEFPAHNVAPLVQAERQVSVGLNPLGVRRVHNRFAGWTNGDWLSEFILTGFGYPGNLKFKTIINGFNSMT